MGCGVSRLHAQESSGPAAGGVATDTGAGTSVAADAGPRAGQASVAGADGGFATGGDHGPTPLGAQQSQPEEDEERGEEEEEGEVDVRVIPQDDEEVVSPSRKLAHKVSAGKIAWKKGELIGAGSYGKVYIGLNESSGMLMAVKEVRASSETEVRALQQEVSLMRSLKHENIVHYLGSDADASLNIVYIFTEWVPGGSISNLLQKFGRLTESVVCNYTQQILRGLAYLHRKGVIHRDIKGANILVDDRGTIKLADFGASKVLSGTNVSSLRESNQSLRGTPYFMAPEVITQSGHGRKADIWSVGCTTLQMLTGKPPWKTMKFSSVSALMYHICNTTDAPPMPQDISSTLRSFLMICFQRNPSERPTASDLLQHPFLVDNTTRHTLATPETNSTASRPVPREQQEHVRAKVERETALASGRPRVSDDVVQEGQSSPAQSLRMRKRLSGSLNRVQDTATSSPTRSPVRSLNPPFGSAARNQGSLAEASATTALTTASATFVQSSASPKKRTIVPESTVTGKRASPCASRHPDPSGQSLQENRVPKLSNQDAEGQGLDCDDSATNKFLNDLSATPGATQDLDNSIGDELEVSTYLQGRAEQSRRKRREWVKKPSLPRSGSNSGMSGKSHGSREDHSEDSSESARFNEWSVRENTVINTVQAQMFRQSQQRHHATVIQKKQENEEKWQRELQAELDFQRRAGMRN